MMSLTIDCTFSFSSPLTPKVRMENHDNRNRLKRSASDTTEPPHATLVPKTTGASLSIKNLKICSVRSPITINGKEAFFLYDETSQGVVSYDGERFTKKTREMAIKYFSNISDDSNNIEIITKFLS